MEAWNHARPVAAALLEIEVSEELDIVDWAHFERSRKELGPGFIRILSYFREDGAKSVAQIEQAMHDQNAAALVLPSHTIKGESRQFGAEPLAKVAELIEQTARLCVETRRFPDELVPEVVELRRLFNRTIELFDQETNLRLGFRYNTALGEQREQALRAEAAARDAQLRMLAYQLNSHFLFNTLNSIRALINEDRGRAREMVTALSGHLAIEPVRVTGPV